MKIAAGFLFIVILTSFSGERTFKGTWKYAGGIYNGKKEGPPADYTLQRKYTDSTFEAFGIDSANKPEKFEAGNYLLKGDTCIETETYSAQPSRLTGKPVVYLYEVRNDSLILKGKLPTGMVVEEYWKRSE